MYSFPQLQTKTNLILLPSNKKNNTANPGHMMVMIRQATHITTGTDSKESRLSLGWQDLPKAIKRFYSAGVTTGQLREECQGKVTASVSFKGSLKKKIWNESRASNFQSVSVFHLTWIHMDHQLNIQSGHSRKFSSSFCKCTKCIKTPASQCVFVWAFHSFIAGYL